MQIRVSALILALLFPSFAYGQSQQMGTLQSVITEATDCITNQTAVLLGQRCYQLNDNTEYFCKNPAAGGSASVCDVATDWGRMTKVYYHATDCRANVTNGAIGDVCWDNDSGEQWGCYTLSGGGSSTACDVANDWRSLSAGGSVVTLQSAFNNGPIIGNATSEANSFQVGNAAEGVFEKKWATSAGFFTKVTPSADSNLTINTGHEFNLYANDGITTRLSVSEAGALDVTGLTSTTGALPVSNLGLSFAESATNPTCAAGDFRLYADLTTFKKCVNGTVSDMDTSGSGGSSTTGTTLALTPGTNAVNTFLIENSTGTDLFSCGTVTGAADGACYWAGNSSSTNYGLRGSATQTMINASTSTLIQQAGNSRLVASSAGVAISPQLRFTYGTEDVALQRNSAGVLEVNTTTQGVFAPFISGFNDAVGNTIGNGLTISRQTTTTPAAGLGAALRFQIESSTTTNQDAATEAALWTDVTHATRTANLVWSLTNSGTLAEVSRLTPVGMIMVEAGANPTAAQLTSGANALDRLGLYLRNDKVCFTYNLSGTVNYLCATLNGSTATWTNSSTAP